MNWKRAVYMLLGLSAITLTAGQEKLQPIETEHHDQRMQWWREARLGLFIHWGLYSVPAGVWKGERAKKNYAEWIMHSHQIPFEEYSQLAKEFNPVKFDADEWAGYAKRAGMGYFVLTTKHHDGFAMFDSDVSDYNIVDATPYDKDVFGELARAFRQRGMRVGAYYSQDIDWSRPQGRTLVGSYNTWDFGVEKNDDALFDEYMHEKALPQVQELATKYHPDLFWFDTPRTVGRERGRLFHDMVRNHVPDAIINGRIATPQGLYADYMVPGDNGYFTSPQSFDWECCATMNESWGYKKDPQHIKTPDELVVQLSTIICAGGNLLLNIGPKPDGTIPKASLEILDAIADWMGVNGEAVHGTQGNPFGEFFSWGGCSWKAGALYLHVKQWNTRKPIVLPRLKSGVAKVELLGDPARKLEWEKSGDRLEINLAGDPVFPSVSVVKVSLSDPSLDIEPVALAEADGGILLECRYAQSRGSKMSALRHIVQQGNVVINLSNGNPNADEHIVWSFDVQKPGRFKVVGEFVDPGSRKFVPRTVNISVGDEQKLSSTLTAESLEQGRHVFGVVEFPDAGAAELALRVEERERDTIFLKAIRLERIR